MAKPRQPFAYTLVIPIGCALGAAATAGWLVHEVSRAYTFFTVQNFLRYWFWVSTPYLGLAAICWWARARPGVSRLLGTGLVFTAGVGFYGMHWYASGTPEAQANYSWLMLYAPLLQWAMAAPFLLIALAIWSVNLRTYRRDKWREYTTRGGTWEAEEEGAGEEDGK